MIEIANRFNNAEASIKEGIIIGLQKWEGCPSG
jgi:hypothetical protein